MRSGAGRRVGGGLGFVLGEGEVVEAEVAVGGGDVEPVEGEVLVEAGEAEEAAEGGLLHVEDVAEAHVVLDEGEDLGGVVVGEAEAGEDALGDGDADVDVAVEADAVGLRRDPRGWWVAGLPMSWRRLPRPGWGRCWFRGGVRGGFRCRFLRSGFASGRNDKCVGGLEGGLGEVFEEEEGVGPDVAFGVVLGGLGDAFEAGDLGEDVGEEAEGVEELEAAAGAAFGEDAGELVADALGGDYGDVGGMALDGAGGAGLDREVETSGEADGAEHAQLVFGEAEVGVADGADEVVGEVGLAVDEIEEGGVHRGLDLFAFGVELSVELEADGVEKHAVDREVAAVDVVGGGGGEADGVGAAAVGVGAVVAEGGDLDGDVF